MDAPAATVTEPRPRWQRVYVITTLAVIGGTLAYALCTWGGWTRLQLDPYSGAWWWQDGPTQTVPINYYGDLLWGLGGAALGGGAGALGTALYRRPLSETTLQLLAAWAITGFLFAGLFYTWSLWPF
jgi:hypothetical protein